MEDVFLLMKKNLIFNIILFLCISLCYGCGKKENNMITYRNFYEADVSTFNYILTNEHSDYTHIANFVDGLVENDKYGNIVPSIAKSWKSEIVEGKQIWTFYLKENVYWSDYNGNKYGIVTANDFVTTLKYILNFQTKSNNYNLPISLIDNALGYYNFTTIKDYNYENILTKINQLTINDPNNELSYYQKIKSAFDYCNSNICSSTFSDVGVKVLNDYELQFTLLKPSPYFLSALTFCPFLPSSEKFIKEVGFNNFGTNKKTLLYNGAYLLKDYFHSSKIEYTKNANYWDKDKVYIDRIIFNRMLNYPTSNYSRLSYELGNIDEFYVSTYDKDGWNKYVVGPNQTGNNHTPYANNTYSITQTNDFTTYYLIFNQNRINEKQTTLSTSEIKISNLALQNTNFRLALIYGLSRSSYDPSYLNDLSSSIVPKNFVNIGSKDYNDYFLEEFSNKNNINLDKVKNEINSDNLILNQSKSLQHLSLALDELNLPEESFPIKLEFSYYFSQDYAKYDEMRIRNWNNMLNGCPMESVECEYTNVQIVFNNALNTHRDFVHAVQNQEYSISILGLYPNYIDPTTYLEAFSSLGELYPFLNHNNNPLIENDLLEINKYYKYEDLSKRFELCAKLEYKLIFELGLVLPLCLKDSSNKIIVSNLVPFQNMKSTYGLSPFKFKLKKKRTQEYTQSDITKLREEYEKGRLSQ